MAEANRLTAAAAAALMVAGLAVLVSAAAFRVSIPLGAGLPAGVVLPEVVINNGASIFSDPPGVQDSGLSAEGEASLLAQIQASLPAGSTASNVQLVLGDNGEVIVEVDVDAPVDPTDDLRNITDIELEFQNGINETFSPPGDDITVTPVDEDDDDTILIIVIVFSILGFYIILAAIFFGYTYWKRQQEEGLKDKPVPLTTISPHERPKEEPVVVETTAVVATSTVLVAEFPTSEPVAAPEPEPEPAPVSPPGVIEEPVAAAATTERARDDIADERAQYLWNATANAAHDPPPGGDVPVAKLANVVSEMPPEGPPQPRDPIADERARYLWNASETAEAMPAPGGGEPVPKMAEVVDEVAAGF